MMAVSSLEEETSTEKTLVISNGRWNNNYFLLEINPYRCWFDNLMSKPTI